MAEHIALHVGVSEGNVAKFNLSDVIRHRQGFCWRKDSGLEREKFKEVGNEEAVVIKPGDRGDEGGEVTLSSTESLEKHHEGTNGDSTKESLMGEKPNDSEHCKGFNDSTEYVEESETARYGKESTSELPADINKAGAKEGG